jgi:hypothetical protein
VLPANPYTKESDMKLNIYLDDEPHTIEVPDELIREAEEFFQKMDRDMDGGWQMGRQWVDAPSRIDRCQIVADKLLTAMEMDDKPSQLLMAAYILSRAPNITRIDIDTGGEMQNTAVTLAEGGSA